MTALLAVDLPAALEAKPNPSLIDLLGLETINDSFNVLNTNLTPATTGVNATGIKSVYNTGTDITIVDSNSKRPRVLRVMFSLTFPLVKYSDEYEAEKDAGVFSTYGAGSTENVLKKNPDKIEFLKGTGSGAVSLFSIQLADGTSADEYDEESPYKDLSTNAQYVKFSDGGDLGDNGDTWQLSNNLIVNLAFYLA